MSKKEIESMLSDLSRERIAVFLLEQENNKSLLKDFKMFHKENSQKTSPRILKNFRFSEEAVDILIDKAKENTQNQTEYLESLLLDSTGLSEAEKLEEKFSKDLTRIRLSSTFSGRDVETIKIILNSILEVMGMDDIPIKNLRTEKTNTVLKAEEEMKNTLKKYKQEADNRKKKKEKK